MRLLVDINHPAHVHFFKNFIWDMKKLGNEIIIVASKKDIALDLLDGYGFDYINIGSYGNTFVHKLINLVFLDIQMLLVVIKHNPDVILGINSVRGAHAGWLLRKKTLIFTDTEHAVEQIALYKPFATKILTPTCFLSDLGPKHVRYSGYHELAYLHPSRFEAGTDFHAEIGLRPADKYFVVRFVSWKATHDFRQHGFSFIGKQRLIDLLSGYGRVIVTSENPLPAQFEPYRMNISPTMIHKALSSASLYIGEGGTMATEAAILGIPSVFVSTLSAGTFKELENKYSLLKSFTEEEEALHFLENEISEGSLFADRSSHKDKLIRDKVDVTSWMVDYVSTFGK